MAGTRAWEARVSILENRGTEPAGRRGTASRRRSLALLLMFACGASVAGAALGLLKQPDPRGHVDQFAFTAAAAVELARKAEERARSAQTELQAANTRIAALSAIGAEQELMDFQEAERMGLSRLMKDSSAFWNDDRRRVMSTIVRESRRNGLDPALVAAVIHVESRFDPFAVSSVGACGLMQLMQPTARWLLEKHSERVKMRRAQLFNPVLNIELGTSYLAQLMNRFDGDLTRALIAYNAGPGVARSLQRGSRSWRRLEMYPKNVLAAYKSLLNAPEQMAAR
jgi:soluble lytic murein transglycosylase-like protein